MIVECLKQLTYQLTSCYLKLHMSAPSAAHAQTEGFPRFRTPGVERVFSAAGKMHDDLKKSATAGTLEMSLFAMQNTD